MNIKYLILVSLLVSSFTDLLADVVSLAAHNESTAVSYKWTNSAYVGYAWSLSAGVTNPDTTIFKQHADGDDGTLANTSYAGIALTRYLYDWLSFGFAYEIYNNFAYQNIHVSEAVSPAPQNSAELFGNKFTRSFSVGSQSALFIVFFNLPDRYKPKFLSCLVEPVFGVGVGPGINYMSGFQTVGLTAEAPFHQISTIGTANVKTSLAWYLNLGIGFKPSNTAATFGLGYRYYVGGQFASGSQFVFYDADNGGDLVTAVPWTGSIRTNQINLFLDFDF